MCGIAGVANLGDAAPPAREAVLRMVSAVRHRGPDEFGLYRDPHAALGHARLSIIDLASGQQPLSNEDGSLWVVFNGEIFNHVELRRELVELGHRFRTQSDTEVIVHAYEAWGNAAFERMNGQWAVALWDAVARRLVLSRDRFGVRPLYFCQHAGRLYFASEVKSLFAAEPAMARAFDPVGLDQTFTFWSVVPPQTVFRGVEELRPGVVRVYEHGAEACEAPYWTARYPERAEEHFAGSLEDAVSAVQAALEQAVSLRMLRSDVPVGAYLSGGLDSSLITALACRHARGRLQTFSLRFSDGEFDESGFQRAMVEQLGAEHHEITVERGDIASCFPALIYHTERPILRTAPAPLFLLSQLVRSAGIKVVLTGEGADEMFAGYDLFREGKVRRFWAKQPESTLRPRALERLYPYLARSPVAQQAMARSFFGRDLHKATEPGFSHGPRWHSTAALKRLFGAPLRDALRGHDSVRGLLTSLPDEFSRWSSLAQDQYLEIRTLMSGYLLSSQGDRTLMAHSVEGRFPFLDRDVVALANSLRPEHKLRVLDEKHVLKRIARGLIPDGILARKKQPYRAPDALAFMSEQGGYVSDLLSEPALREAAVFDPRAVTALWQKCKTRGADHAFSNADNMALVGVISTQLVHHHFVRGKPHTRTDIPLTVDVWRP